MVISLYRTLAESPSRPGRGAVFPAAQILLSPASLVPAFPMIQDPSNERTIDRVRRQAYKTPLRAKGAVQ